MSDGQDHLLIKKSFKSLPFHRGDLREKKSGRKPRCIYGNYHGYYGYRLDSNGLDHRLERLQVSWFNGKRVLDIGCNAGVITLYLATKYNLLSILGMDLDSALIAMAEKNKIKASQKLKTYKSWQLDQHIVADPLTHGISKQEYDIEEKEMDPFPSQIYEPCFIEKWHFVGGGKANFVSMIGSNHHIESTECVLANVHFQVGNYIDMEAKVSEASYDTICCLSVTKWIHLNWGDEGVLKLFRKVNWELALGGVFILEFQEISSYKKTIQGTKELRHHYRHNQILPSQFPDILVNQMGFSLLDIVSSSPQRNPGFDRPIYVFSKISQVNKATIHNGLAP